MNENNQKTTAEKPACSGSAEADRKEKEEEVKAEYARKASELASQQQEG